MDYAAERALDHLVRAHHLLVDVVRGVSTWGVVAFGLAVVALWLLDPPGTVGRWRRACVAALASAAVALLLNQVIAHAWDRPRPYEDHPATVVPLLPPSHDPSFPSDHAGAAFAIAAAV